MNMVDANTGLTAKTINYQYDQLYRLTQADYTNTANETDITQTYQYDPLGNMTFKSDVGQFVYNGQHPHAVTQAGSHIYDYDANGNMIVRDSDSMTYDYRDRLIQSAGKASFAYGEGYNRLTKTELINGTTTYYPDRHFEVHPEKEVKYIYAGDLRIAKIEKELNYTPPTPEPGPTPVPDPNPNPQPDPQPNPDPTPDPTPNPQPAPQPNPTPQIPQASAQGTGGTGSGSGTGGGGYGGSQDQLRLMRLISQGQEEEARKLSKQIYLYSLNSLDKEKKQTMIAGALPESAFENLRIIYKRNSALITWDSMPDNITSFRILRSKGNHATALDDAEIFLDDITAGRFKNRYVHKFDKSGARYSYQIVAMNKRGKKQVISFKLHSNQIFIYENQQKIVDFRNFSRTDFTHVRIKSNTFVDGKETSIPQRLLLKPDSDLENGVRLSVNFLICENKSDGSRICKKTDSQFVELYVLNRAKLIKKTVTFINNQINRLYAAFMPTAYAEVNDETTYYLLTDHLGSVDVVLDEAGDVVERRDYLPYGSERMSDSAPDATETDHKFTGKELDDETGLYYYGARYYDSEIGRFVSVDPWEGDLKDPQSFNKYSYVQNNPIICIDTTGMYKEDVHYDLTLYLGMNSGIGYENAKTIAYRNQYMDVNPDTNPHWSHWAKDPEAVSRHHFQTREGAISNLNLAIEYGSIEEVGDLMHTFQDTYSHAGLTPLKHAELDDAPDLTYSTTANLAKANRMARASFFQLRKLNLKINGSGDITKDEYLRQSTEIWSRVQHEINDYLSMEDKEGTRIEVLADIAKGSENDE